ncbi:recombination-associated protein RdgC [Diaphorobacter sp. HDW4B]|uniref:recombination-associated protein RdgC n=1 Tax=Diaphorobacter sp. HDW4B TaxID=2714925 RepID=UPI00140C7994|nr:recombination-associated protein RdgC [Diaphorobacter sp. HDW4B]QIL72898.1 recombination-associated protein RdgC [Diaphorobacter sp. HDW4B]
MLKNLIIYRIATSWSMELATAEATLAKSPFEECGPTQEKSVGWVPPRGEEHGSLVESVGGQWIARLMTESKVIPGSVLARKVKEKAARIEQETGRKPGKKESKELKEEAKLDLLPMAFTKQGSTWVWIDPEAHLLVLVDALPGFAVALLDTAESPQACMAHWLKEQEPPTGFSIDRECELKSADEAKAVVKYGRHPLDIDEVGEHIDQGKLPTKLAMTWDDRVSFVLTEGLQIKKVSFLDTVFEGQKQDDSGFDADVAIVTGELTKLLPDLIEALGGEGRTELSGASTAAHRTTIVTGSPVGTSHNRRFPSRPLRMASRLLIDWFVQRRFGSFRAHCAPDSQAFAVCRRTGLFELAVLKNGSTLFSRNDARRFKL